MDFLKSNFLLIVSFGIFVLSSFAYGYDEEHWARLKECSENPQIEKCDLRDTDLSDLNLTISRSLMEYDFTGANLMNAVVMVMGDRMAPPFIDFTDTDIRGADVKMPETVEVEWAGAKYDKDTEFSRYFNPEEHGMVFIEKECSFLGFRCFWK